MKPYQLYILFVAIVAGFVILSISLKQPAATFGSISSQGLFRGTGTTNSSTTVNTTSTQVIPAGWTNYASISNNSPAIVWCSLDGATAASSSAASGVGVKIGAVSTTFSGEVYACFGPQPNCIGYIGPINCVSSGAAAKIGITYN